MLPPDMEVVMDPLDAARGIARGIGISLLLVLLTGLIVVGAARGQVLDARMDQLDNEIGVFMASKGYATPEAPVLVGPDSFFDERDSSPGTPEGRPVAFATEQGTLLSNEVVGWLDDPVNFGRLVNVLAHEKLHRLRGIAPEASGWDDTDRALEEAAVESVARDITAAFMAARYPWVDYSDFDEFYPDAVAMVRSCSARAVRKPWYSTRAKLWRRGFWRSPAERRRARITACGVKL